MGLRTGYKSLDTFLAKNIKLQTPGPNYECWQKWLKMLKYFKTLKAIHHVPDTNVSKLLKLFALNKRNLNHALTTTEKYLFCSFHFILNSSPGGTSRIVDLQRV